MEDNEFHDRRLCMYWNPNGDNSLPQHSINPMDFIRRDSSTLVSDVKVLCLNMLPLSAAAFSRRD
jgi:type IV secretion system protein VirD4